MEVCVVERASFTVGVGSTKGLAIGWLKE